MSASRTPKLFQGPAALSPPISADSLSRLVANALTQVNAVSITSGHMFSNLWIMDPSGAVVSSARPEAPSELVRATARAAMATDSLTVAGPYPGGGHELRVVFLQPVDASRVDSAHAAPSPRGSSSAGGAAIQSGAVGSVALLSTIDATTLAAIGLTPPGAAGEPTSLVVTAGDSIFRYTLSRRAPHGFRVAAWPLDAAPPAVRAVVRGSTADSRLDASAPLVSSRVKRLPWWLVREANTEILFAAADARLKREGAIAALVLTALGWLWLARSQRQQTRHLRALAESESRYRLLADYSTDIIARHSLDGSIQYISPAVQAVLGYAPAELIGSQLMTLRHDEDAELTGTAVHRVLSLDGGVRMQHRIRHADGHFVWLETVGQSVRDSATGAVTGFVSTSRDVSRAKGAELALRGSEEQYRLVFEANPMPMWMFDANTSRFLAVNDAAITHYGYSRDEFLRMTLYDIRLPEHAGEVRPVIERFTQGTRKFPAMHHRTKDGQLIEVDLTVHPLPGTDGATCLVLINDVTNKRAAERALRDANEFVRAILDSSPIAIVATDLDLRVAQWNRAAEQLFGWSQDEVHGRVSPLIASQDAPAPVSELRERVLREGQVTGIQRELARKDGTRVEVALSFATVRHAAGEPSGLVALALDLTERHRLEAQLRQAQKMEAVGQLAGGVAHDFNNLLTVITTYSELLLADAPQGGPMHDDLREIKGAGERAAELTRQLLAFSRQQVLEPRVIALNTIIRGVEQMLRRVLPPTIHLIASLDPELGPVYADPGQIEQLLMNLIVNARDAMPDGGTLTISTSNLDARALERLPVDAPNGAVALVVADTGHGMSREVQERIFEPFYTTKDVGKGTGLGLSTVHGIVAQSGGTITVASEVGAGTTFTIHLPVGSGPSSTSQSSAGADLDVPLDVHTAVVLLVEDEPAVRAAATRILERAGYDVLVAADGPEALSIHATDETRIDVVVTDLAMPTMSGAALADALRERQPHLPVVFMSGFVDDAMAGHGTDQRPVVLLHKPFTPDSLTRKVREALRSSPRTAPGAGRVWTR